MKDLPYHKYIDLDLISVESLYDVIHTGLPTKLLDRVSKL